MSESATLDLALVMPVYNEEECVASVVEQWRQVFRDLGLKARLIVINDGSRDGTAEALAPFEPAEDVDVVNRGNRGHGPTILQGYHRAVELAPWVFQCDSDDEIPAEAFPKLWEKREGQDAVMGIRTGRVQDGPRRLMSAASRMVVRAFFGSAVSDVNAPFRLMASSVLKKALALIPDDTFAPNVLISGYLARQGHGVLNVAVEHRPRQTGTVSLVNARLLGVAWKAFRQTLAGWWRLRALPAPGPEDRGDS